MPVVFETSKNKVAFLSVWRIDETENQLKELISFTGPMSNQFKLITNSEKRLEWLASRLLIQRLTRNAPCISHSSSGKPKLNHSNLYISISHTQGFAAVVVSNQNCGVDMEYPSPRISRLSERFINASEEEYIQSLDSATYHALIWCAKETLYKTAGISGLIFKDQMRISQFIPAESGALTGQIISRELVQNYSMYYRITDEYYLVWHW